MEASPVDGPTLGPTGLDAVSLLSQSHQQSASGRAMAAATHQVREYLKHD
jgi:hypothetical protein